MLKLFFVRDGWQCATLASSIEFLVFLSFGIDRANRGKYVASLQSDGCRCFLFHHRIKLTVVVTSRAKALLRVHLRRQDPPRETMLL